MIPEIQTLEPAKHKEELMIETLSRIQNRIEKLLDASLEDITYLKESRKILQTRGHNIYDMQSSEFQNAPLLGSSESHLDSEETENML
jgi:hypothetical protein